MRPGRSSRGSSLVFTNKTWIAASAVMKPPIVAKMVNIVTAFPQVTEKIPQIVKPPSNR
jgi:hypothetical protein